MQPEEQVNVKLILQRIQTSTMYEEKLESMEKLLELSGEKQTVLYNIFCAYNLEFWQ